MFACRVAGMELYKSLQAELGSWYIENELEVWLSLLSSYEEAYWHINFNADTTFFGILRQLRLLMMMVVFDFLCLVCAFWLNITWKAEFWKQKWN